MSIIHGSLYKHLKDIRTDGEQKSYEARIPVLIFLISTANLRLRTWHGIKAIMKHTGYSKAPVVEAINWLESRGAIYNVPKEARTGSEKRVHANRKVLQLTGILQLGKTIIDYLYLKDEDRTSVLLEVEEHAPQHVKELFISLNLIEETNEMGSDDEPETDKQEGDEKDMGSDDEPKNQGMGSDDEPKIGSQNGTAKELGESNLINIELDKTTICVDEILSSEQIKQLTSIHQLQPQQNLLTISSESDDESDIVIEAKEHLKKSKVEKSRDRLYDMIALVCFDLEPQAISKASKQTTSRIGKIKKELIRLDDIPDENALADEFWLFKKSYKHKFPDAAIPRSVDKVVLHFLSLREQSVVQDGFNNTHKPTAEDYAVNNDVDYENDFDEEAVAKLLETLK